MIQNKKSIMMLVVALCAAAVLLPAAGCGGSSSDAVKSVAAGSLWEIGQTTRLTHLTIAEGAIVKATDDHMLTMTVNQVETAIQPGSYDGDIVLTPTEKIVFKDTMFGGSFDLRTAVYVEDGAVVKDKSVLSAVAGGQVTGTEATDIQITSTGANFNGIIATGKTPYKIDAPKINFTGNGGSDFAAVGAAITSSGHAEVTVNNASIITNGAIRTAVWAGGDSTMRVNDSTIETGNPPLPKDYVDVFTQGGKVMMSVPFMLGITGTCRATNLLERATAYYTNSHIKSQGWGCLSVDAADGVKLYATHCTIETVESGYGAYSMGGSVDTFSGCTFNVADMAVIGTGGDCVFTDDTVVNSRRFGVMYHGSGDITIDKGSVFNTKSTAIQLKSPGHTVVVDNARLNPENGIILQVMANDDPYMVNGHMPDSMGSEGDRQGGEMPAMRAKERTGTDATFTDVTLTGDIFNGNTAAESLSVAFKKASITGAITTATVEHALGPDGEKLSMKTPELYYLIGKVTNIPAAKPEDPHGLTVSLDAESSWVVEKTSYLTGLTLEKGAAVTGPPGARVTMTVNGSETPIGPGSYSGQIVLAVETL